MSGRPTNDVAGIRGPAEHVIREQIVKAANEHFRHYGYTKTTVSDLAKAIGFSKAYIYRFFESKQAIAEAICTSCMTSMRAEIENAITGADTATEKLRCFIKTVTETSVDLFFADRKLYEIVTYAASERWKSSEEYNDLLRAMLHEVIVEGRQRGEFERKTPLDEVCSAIFYAISPFSDPLMLERNLDLLPDGPNNVTGLILRSLAV